MITNWRIRAVQLVLAGAGFAMANAVATAQEKSETAEVKIEAARPVERIGRTSSGAPIEIVQLTRRVSYADLDLATHEGAKELENRVNETAKAACKQLDTLYPLGTSQGPGTRGLHCVKDAVAGAMPQLRAAVTAAEKRVRSAELPR